MGQQRPAFVNLDGCPAITDLDHLPRVFGLQKKLALIPARELVGPDEIQVLAVLPPDHRIAAAHLARKQRHALVAGRRSAHWNKLETPEIARPHDFGQIGRASRREKTWRYV